MVTAVAPRSPTPAVQRQSPSSWIWTGATRHTDRPLEESLSKQMRPSDSPEVQLGFSHEKEHG